MLSKALLGTDYPVLAENKELVQDWLTDENNPHIGTVHTFQGREANEVIFLLGCDEDSKKSANWVKKNIINVAVSRARYRLYVIGDIKVWNQCEPVMEMKCDLDSYVWETLAWLANAQGSSASIDDLKIPALPSAEMYEIERVEDSSEEDYIINTTSGNENIRAFLPSVQTEAFPKALHLLEITSMEDFYKSFHPDIQRLLNTGVSLYDVLCRQADMEHLASYDMSCIGINFCKAFELTLKQNYFPGLQKLLPNVLIGGRKISEINTQQYQMTIGDFTTIISQNQELLAKQMSHHGYKEMHSEWWKTLLQKMQDFKKYRNACCHSGQEKAFTLKELENCLNLLFKEFKVPKKGLLGKEGSIRGLMLDTCFRDAINSIRKNTDFTGNNIIAADQIQTDTTGVPLLDFTDQYVEITVRTKFCVVDGSILTQEAIPVRRTNGQSKKLNMQYCSKCGRCYLNVAKLSESTHLKDYKLTAIKPEEWK